MRCRRSTSCRAPLPKTTPTAAKRVKVGEMFVTETGEFEGPRWIINFPTKEHWKGSSRLEWVEAGLQDLKRVLRERQIKSVAIPPLGAGNGGLDWPAVKSRIQAALGDVEDVEILVYEPTDKYQNVAKRGGGREAHPGASAGRRSGAPLLGAGHGMQPA